MRYLRPIPRRLLPDDMLVWVPDPEGGFERARLVRHVRFEYEQSVVDEPHRCSDAGHGRVLVDSANSDGAFEVPAGSRVLIGAGPAVFVKSCKRCCVLRGQVHHWELEVG